MKVRNRLLNFGKMIIYQDDDYFLFSLDSLLLANFVTIRLNDKKIIDFCTGNAPIPMFLSFRTKARIFGVEIQEYIYKLGYDSVVENRLSKQIELLNMDVNKLNTVFEAESFDVVTCNPPYFKCNKGSLTNIELGKSMARHEIAIKLDDCVKMASLMLKNGGTFAMVHRPDRLIEIINVMQKYHIEPKKMRLVYPKDGKNANMLLIEGVKNGKSGLKIEAPLVVHNDNGEYVEEIRKMFGSDTDVAEKL